MKTKIQEQSILSVESGVIVHQVNTLKAMGAGLAAKIKEKFPKAYSEYIAVDWELGQTQFVEVGENLYVCNLAGQQDIGSGVQTDYEALQEGLIKVREFVEGKDLQIYLPFKIGCGLAGGDWATVRNIIDKNCSSAIVCKIPEKIKQIATSQNIWSQSNDEFAASLTNPTGIAKWYKRLPNCDHIIPADKAFFMNTKTKTAEYKKVDPLWHDRFIAYPVEDNRGRWYADLETCYTVYKTNDLEKNYQIMIRLLITKLTQYSELVAGIKQRGGVKWLESCSHEVYGKSIAWEGKGVESGFIRCLITAYLWVA